jgi:hypothetical protein
MGKKPIHSHFFPPICTIGSAVSHCQRFKLKKTRGDSDLDHILSPPGANECDNRGESNCYGIFLNGVSDRERRSRLLTDPSLGWPSSLTHPSLVRGRFDPVRVARQRIKKSRPLSRVLSWAAIPLGCASPRSSSDLPGSPCGPHVAAFRPPASLFGLAPGGVCRAVDVAARAVRSYRTISPLPAPLTRRLGGIFLLHFPWTRVPQALPGTVPCGARTFLHVRSTQRLPGRL